MEPIRVLIADDHAIVRSGLRLLINSQRDMQVIDEAGDGWETVEKTVHARPDVLLLDITMPGLNGLEVARELQRKADDVRILVLTMHDDEAYLRQFLLLGVAGYVVKKAADNELVAAIRAVHRGETFVRPSLTSILVARYLDREGTPSAVAAGEKLTTRETEVLRLVAQGYTSEQVAEQLSISVNTVQTHRAHIKEKLGLHGRAELVRYALARGLLSGGT